MSGVNKVLFGICILMMPLFTLATECRVVGVVDGDTIRCLTDDNALLKVRLAQIDAPEKKQAFGQVSKKALSDYIFDKKVILHAQKRKDRYRRVVAEIEYHGENINRKMVKNGFAWAYDEYVSNFDYFIDQQEAKIAKRGLWIDPHPQPPWKWRKSR